MMRSAISAVSFTLALLSTPAWAEETYTQLGTWECKVTGQPGAFVCPEVAFPTPLASVTAIIVIGCSAEGLCYGRNNIQYSNVTSSGFNPVLYTGEISDWRGVDIKPRTVIGQWIAVGSRAGIDSLAPAPSSAPYHEVSK
jgi:hypothetical protein